MTFSLDVFKRAGSVGLAAVAVAAALTGCGGGEQKEQFNPSRIVAFGDENSLIAPNGYQYTANNELTAGVAPCTVNPGWVQVVALNYGLSFGECAGQAARASTQMKAVYGATVASTRAAINTFHATSPLRSSDLVTVMAGTHDLIALYETHPNATDAELTVMAASARLIGRDLGTLVFEVVGRGAKILVTTVPNLGTAPIALPANAGDTRRAVVLSTLSIAFNDGFNERLGDDPNGGGRSGAVIEVDQLVERYRRNYELLYSGFGDRVNAACVVDNTASPLVTIDNDKLLTDCKSSVVTSVRAGWAVSLWAGNYHFGAPTHYQLGNDAFQRIRNNPL